MNYRAFYLILLIFSSNVLFADDVMLVRMKDGRAYAKNVNDVDSVYFAFSSEVSGDLFVWTDTIHAIKDYYYNHDILMIH